MKDVQGSPVEGRTRWRRFAAVSVPATLLAGAIVFGQATGAIGASFNVSGQTFKVSADRLVGKGFVQYGGIAHEKGANPNNPLDPKNHPVAVSGMRTAEITNLCQSVKVPNLPVSMVIRAGRGSEPATATNLLIDVAHLEGNASFKAIDIGIDASDLTKGPPGAVGQQSAFAQEADQVVLTNLKQVAWSTSAGEFNLNGLDLSISVGAKPEECFS